MQGLMEREHERTAEWNHSCTSQCSQPCTVNRAAPVVGDVVTSPEMWEV